MSNEHLSSSAFADRIGVPRSTISHILSGRNKPSLDLVQKILQSFPSYDADWLILDRDSPKKSLKEPQLFSDTESNGVGKEVLPKEPDNPQFTNVTKEEPPIIQQVKQEEQLPYGKAIKTSNNKQVEQIIVCYSDKTFTSYVPGKD